MPYCVMSTLQWLGKDYEITPGPLWVPWKMEHTTIEVITLFFPSTVIAFKSGCVRTSLLLFPVFSNTKLGSEFDLAAAEPP